MRLATSRQECAVQVECESEDDGWEVELLLDTAFGAERKGLSAYRLREGIDAVPDLSLLVRDDLGLIVGCIRFWPVRIGDSRSPALMLGPIAIHPTRQGEGIGASLILEGLERARRSGWKIVILVGDLDYYGRFGFRKCSEVTFPPPTDPERILWLDLEGGRTQKVFGQVRRWVDMP